MRIATYNIEWFTNLFDHHGKMMPDSAWSSRYNVTRADQIGSLGIVFTAMDADAIMVIEAPDQNRRRTTTGQLEAFAAHFGLRTRRAIMGFPSETEQEIALLYDPDVLTVRHDPKGDATGKKGASDAPRFDGVFRMDLDVDTKPELVTFSKPPLELAVKTADGLAFRMIGVHAKSKAPHGAHDGPDGPESLRIGIENRRKQLAQCVWLRERIAKHLAKGESLMVMGDFNDGPGLDEYEKLFGHSGVEIVLGLADDPALRLQDPHAQMALTQRVGVTPTTARFYMPQNKRYFEALLDYIMVSADLAARKPQWRIWHPFNDPICWHTPELRDALLAASDHFPVTIDLPL